MLLYWIQPRIKLRERVQQDKRVPHPRGLNNPIASLLFFSLDTGVGMQGRKMPSTCLQAGNLLFLLPIPLSLFLPPAPLPSSPAAPWS